MRFSLKAVLILISLGGLAYAGVQRENRMERLRSECKRQRTGIRSAIGMLCIERELTPQQLVWNADLVFFLNHHGYFDGGDDACPTTGLWSEYRLTPDIVVECRFHGTSMSPRTGGGWPAPFPVPPRAAVPTPISIPMSMAGLGPDELHERAVLAYAGEVGE